MMKSKYPKCPKCKTQNVELIEVWDATISWSPCEPYFNNGNLNPGDPKKVEGHCLNCDHKWTIRKVPQVQPEWFEVTNWQPLPQPPKEKNEHG